MTTSEGTRRRLALRIETERAMRLPKFANGSRASFCCSVECSEAEPCNASREGCP